MDSIQTKSMIQLLGLGSLAFGLYAAWDQYQQIAGLANAFLGSGNEGRSMFDGLMSQMNYDLGSLVAKQPWVWIGVVLVVAPYLIGLGGRSRPESTRQLNSATVDLFVNCRECGEAVRENAPFCQHCGSAR